MGSNESKLKAYEDRQVEKLREKVKAYSNSEIDRYNVIRNIAFAMQEIAKKKLTGSKKKEIVRSIILELLNPNSYPVEMVNTIVDNFIEDMYTSFRKTFKSGRCC